MKKENEVILDLLLRAVIWFLVVSILMIEVI